jgi:peptidoglycan-associated lipoprotein
MKMKMFYSTALALAVILASTGCKHKPVGVTAIPGPNSASVGGLGAAPTYNGNSYPGGTGVGSQGIAQNQNWDVSQFNQDRDALAADTVHFAYDSAVIRDSEQSSIQAVASALNADPNAKLLIEGNCDERGTEEYNRSLGERRALAAREALAKLGVNPDRIRTISYGKDKPADPGHDEAAWAKNRRDDFVLLHPKMGA